MFKNIYVVVCVTGDDYIIDAICKITICVHFLVVIEILVLLIQTNYNIEEIYSRYIVCQMIFFKINYIFLSTLIN